MEALFYYDAGDPWSGVKLGPSYGTLFRILRDRASTWIVPVAYRTVERGGWMALVAIEDESHYRGKMFRGGDAQWTYRIT